MHSLIEACQNAKHIMFITGAGISVASGLPTYREVGGLYTDSIIPAALVMSKFAFKWMPSLTWRHLHKGYKSASDVKPNAAHDAIAAMELLTDRITVVTQNVDGLHTKAGSTEVIELHGHADVLECSSCNYTNAEPNFSSLGKVPRCPLCKAVLRPPVVLFGERLPQDAVNNLVNACADKPDVIIAVGTTGNFPYIVAPLEEGRRHGAVTAVIDPSPPENFVTDIWVKEKAEEALPYIAGKMNAC